MRQDEAPTELPPAPKTMATEVKEKLDGRAQRFELERWLRTPDLFVGRWVSQPGNEFGAPVGMTSWGVWWRIRPYGAYRIHDVDGGLRLYRFDALDRVRIDGSGVRYRDLLLDVRMRREADGGLVVRLEDEDEVEEASASGRLSAHELLRVRRTRRLFVDASERLAARVDGAIAQAVEVVRAG